MGERLQKLPKWARTVLVVAGIVAPVSGAVVTAVKTYYEIRSAQHDANAAKKEATTTHAEAASAYDTLSPAILELQEILNQAQEWAAGTDEDLDQYDARLERCEQYMERLARRRGFPRMPELAEESDPPWYETSPLVTSAVPMVAPEPPRPKPAAKAMRPIPQSMEKAADYQQQRVKKACSPDDPLCGAEVIERPPRIDPCSRNPNLPECTTGE